MQRNVAPGLRLRHRGAVFGCWLLMSTVSLAAPEPGEWAALGVPETRRPRPIERHRELMAEATAGQGASPVFRPAWSWMEVDLALQSHGQTPPLLSEATQARYRDLSFAAATMGVERLVNEWVDGSDVLVGARYGVRTVLGPNLVFEPQDRRIRLNQAPAHRYAQVQRDSFEDPRRGPRPPALKLGAGTRVVTDELLDESTIQVAYSAYLQADRLGLDAVRASVDLATLSLDARRPADPAGAWTVQARQRIRPRVTVIGDVRSLPETYLPDRARGTVALTPFHSRLWQVRLSTTAARQDEELRGDLRVQYNGGWHMPTAPGRFPQI